MKPRVHHVITRLIIGGAQENTVLSCQGLLDRYDVKLLSGPPEGIEGSLIEETRRRGIPLEILPELVRPVRPLTDLEALRRLVSIFRRERPHLVHTHSSKAGALGRLAARLAGVPAVVHTIHGLHFYEGQPWAARAAVWVAEKLGILLTDRMVCVGEAMRAKALDAGLGRRELFEIVPSGIEIDPFLKARPERGRWGVPEGVPVVGVVSRLAPLKGHRYLVEAAPPGIHLLFVGGGVEREALGRAVAERGLGATFTGQVAPEEVPGLIASMDLVVHPSLLEGLPRAAVQGLLAAKPVIAFDCDGAREVVVDGVTGRLVPPRSVAELRSAIEEILSLPDRGRSMGREGRRRFAERFEWRAAARQLDAIYRRLLARTGTAVL